MAQTLEAAIMRTEESTTPNNHPRPSAEHFGCVARFEQPNGESITVETRGPDEMKAILDAVGHTYAVMAHCKEVIARGKAIVVVASAVPLAAVGVCVWVTARVMVTVTR